MVILLVAGVSRLAELVISTRRRGQRPTSPDPVYPLMVVLHLAVFIAIPAEVFVLDRPYFPMLFWSMLVVLLGATILRVWILASLGAAWNVRVVKPDRVIDTGVYRYVRHPNYVVVGLELLALTLLHSAWISAVILNTMNIAVLRMRVVAEERVLFAIPDYCERMGRKPRFIPRLF